MDSCAAAAREDGDEERGMWLWSWMIQVIDEWIKTKNIHGGSHCSCRDEPGAMREADPEQRATHENDRTNSLVSPSRNEQHMRIWF